MAGNQEPSGECILMTDGTSPERSEIQQQQMPAFMQPQIIPSVIQESTLEQSISDVYDPDCSVISGRVLSNRVNSQGQRRRTRGQRKTPTQGYETKKSKSTEKAQINVQKVSAEPEIRRSTMA